MQVCCVTEGPNGNLQQQCIPAGSFCGNRREPGVTITCDEKGDCPAGDSYCCANLGQVLNPTFSCVSSQTCAGFINGIICKSDGDCPMDRPRCCPEPLSSLVTMGVSSRLCRSTPCN
jgi:hypothetical protein